LLKTLIILCPVLITMLFSGAVRSAELIMFETRGCPWCAQWHKQIGPGYPKSTEGQRAPLRRVDLADLKNSNVNLRSPVTVSPTFVLVDDERKEVGRITGYPGADFFWGILADLTAKLDRKAATGVTGTTLLHAGTGASAAALQIELRKATE
jgi:thioredoxin-related protein